MAQSVSSFNIRSFKADAVNKNLVQLNWIVSCTTTDSAQLVVERSGDGISFQPLYTMSAITDSACQYVDKLPLFDSGYYRLVCKNGSTQPVYSAVQKIKILSRAKVEISIMPNPVFNNASVIINNEETGDIICTLYDLSGKNIRTYQFKKTGQYAQHILDMYSVPRGDYILTIRGNTINESKRILKQ
jgi:hypothetical protein